MTEWENKYIYFNIIILNLVKNNTSWGQSTKSRMLFRCQNFIRYCEFICKWVHILQHLTLNSRINCLKKNDLCVWYNNKTSFGAADLGKMLGECSQGNAVKTPGSRPKRILSQVTVSGSWSHRVYLSPSLVWSCFCLWQLKKSNFQPLEG